MSSIQSTRNSKQLGIFFTITSGIIFGVTPLLVTKVFDLGYNSIATSFYRYFFGLPFLYLINRYKKLNMKLTKPDLIKTALIGTLGLGATTLLLSTSYNYVSTGIATTSHFLYPTFVCLLSAFLLKERLSTTKIICLIASFLGVAFFADLTDGGNGLGICIAVLSGFAYSIYITMMAKTGIMNRYSPFTITFYIGIACSMMFFILALAFDCFKLPGSWSEFGLLAIISLLCQVFGIAFMQLGIHSIGPDNAALFSLFEPLTSNVIGILFLNDGITWKKLIGCALIFYAVLKLAFETLKKE